MGKAVFMPKGVQLNYPNPIKLFKIIFVYRIFEYR